MSYKDAAEYLKSKITEIPKTAVVLGTGLGDIADELRDKIVIPYAEIPGFPSVGGAFHKCRAVFGRLGGKYTLFMQGRIHYYEGFSMQEVVFPIRMLSALGVQKVILTNASGAINEDFAPGDLVLISDHIKLGLDSPLRGRNDDEMGDRFIDMTNAYDKNLRGGAKSAAERLGLKLFEGVYAYMAGPQFETPAEINMLRAAGADLVGMSTVPEVIAGVHCGLKILGISGVSNMAAGIEGGGLNNSVIQSAEGVLREKLKALLNEIL